MAGNSAVSSLWLLPGHLAGVRMGVRWPEPLGLKNAGLRTALPSASRPGVPIAAASAAAALFLVLAVSAARATRGPAHRSSHTSCQQLRGVTVLCLAW